MIMIRGHFGVSLIHEITTLVQFTRSTALRKWEWCRYACQLSPRSSLSCSMISLCWHSSRWLDWAPKTAHCSRRTSVTPWRTLAPRTPARSLQCQKICLFNTALADPDGTILQKGAFSAAYQIAVGLCTVSTEVSEVVVDKVHVSAMKKVNTSALIDPLDDSEFFAAASGQIEEWYRNCKVIKFGHPLPDKEPDQVTAMTRVVELKLEPYADFSTLTPHGRRMAKNLRHRSWIPQADGTYQPLEVPGPESPMTWEACFAVWEVIMLMLRYPPDKEGDQPAQALHRDVLGSLPTVVQRTPRVLALVSKG